MGAILDFLPDVFFTDDVVEGLFQRFRRAKPAKGPKKIGAYDDGAGSLITGQIVEARLKGHGKTKALVLDPHAVSLVALTDHPGPGAFELASLAATKVGRLYALPSVVYKASDSMCKPIRGQKRLPKADFERVVELIPN